MTRNPEMAARLAALADRMTPQVAVARLRVEMARGTRREARARELARLEDVERALRVLAVAHAAPERWADVLHVYPFAPALLTRVAVERLAWHGRTFTRGGFTASTLRKLAAVADGWPVLASSQAPCGVERVNAPTLAARRPNATAGSARPVAVAPRGRPDRSSPQRPGRHELPGRIPQRFV